MLAKPSAVALPLVVAAIDCVLVAAIAQPAVVKSLAPWLVLAVAVIVLTKSQQADARMDFKPTVDRAPLGGRRRAGVLPGKTGRSVAIGFRLRPFAPARARFARRLLPVARACAAVGPDLLLATAGKWYAAAGIFVGGLLPTLGFIPFLYQDYSTVADRYMYLPMLGVSLALAAWLAAALVAGDGGRLRISARSLGRDELRAGHVLARRSGCLPTRPGGQPRQLRGPVFVGRRFSSARANCWPPKVTTAPRCG